MKTLTIAVLFLFLGHIAAVAQQYMHVTLIESVVAMGVGRSKILITQPNGTTVELEAENLFSAGGINFGNIKGNESTIIKKFNELSGQGWKVISVACNSNDGIFMTRYLLQKDN